MHRSLRFKALFLLYFLLAGLFFFFPAPLVASATEVSIGTIIDTVGMVTDHTTIAQGTGSSVNGSYQFYHDSSMSNGGGLKLTKAVNSGGQDIDSGSVDAQKVMSYDAAGSGAHLSGSESAYTRSAVSSGSAQSPACAFASGDSGNTSQVQSASSSLEIANANSLELTTSTKISPGNLHYSVSANSSPISGNYSGPATIVSSFTYGSETSEQKNQVTDRTMVSGLFDLFNRVYQAENGATIQAQTQASGMVSSKTVTEHTYDQVNRTTSSAGWSGSSVYTADTLTNGGNIDETRAISADSGVSAQRVVSYQANGSESMQTEEKIVAAKEVSSGINSSSAAVCVFAGDDRNMTDSTTHQSVAASSLLFGVDSAQSVSVAQIDMGSRSNGTMPLVVNYKAEIVSPIQFDAGILQTMTDPNKDGRFEDLNGNGRQDMQDLVLLFRNFEWLSKSSLSSRFDFNNNGRVDLADLTRTFKDIHG